MANDHERINTAFKRIASLRTDVEILKEQRDRDLEAAERREKLIGAVHNDLEEIKDLMKGWRAVRRFIGWIGVLGGAVFWLFKTGDPSRILKAFGL